MSDSPGNFQNKLVLMGLGARFLQQIHKHSIKLHLLGTAGFKRVQKKYKNDTKWRKE